MVYLRPGIISATKFSKLLLVWLIALLDKLTSLIEYLIDLLICDMIKGNKLAPQVATKLPILVSARLKKYLRHEQDY